MGITNIRMPFLLAAPFKNINFDHKKLNAKDQADWLRSRGPTDALK